MLVLLIAIENERERERTREEKERTSKLMDERWSATVAIGGEK